MSSVVAPGLTALPPSSKACAAIRHATRIASITSGVRTPLPLSRLGAGLSTYSGRGMPAGAERRGDWMPDFNGARWTMSPPYDVVPNSEQDRGVAAHLAE